MTIIIIITIIITIIIITIYYYYHNTCFNCFIISGNSAYGLVLHDKTKHINVKYVHGERSAKILVNDPHFISLCEIGVDVYRIESLKNKIDLDMPIALGFLFSTMQS